MVNLVCLGFAGTLGIGVRDRRERHAADVAAAEQRAELERLLAAEERKRADAIAVEERLRLTRELHDVIGHALSVMVVQAGVAERMLERRPDEARLAVGRIARTGRDSLSEMRRLLEVMRDGDGSVVPARHPRPGSTTCQALVDEVRAAGLDVSLESAGTGQDLAGRAAAGGLPDRAGGTHELPQAPSGNRATVRVRPRPRDRGGGRRRRPAGSPTSSRATASPGCGSACPSTAASLEPARVDGGGFGVRAQRSRSLPQPRSRARPVIRVVVADDQALVRSGFALILDSEPTIDVVAEAADGAEALAAVRRHDPDVVLMDIRMPGIDGIEATRHLTTNPQTAHVKVLVLTTFDGDEYVYDALRAGASGFLLKDTTPEDLIRAVHVVAEGESLLAPSVTKRLIERFVEVAPTRADGRGALPELTERERDVLVASRSGLSNVEIGEQLHVSYSTVKTHVSHLLAKLERTRPRPARGAGLPQRRGQLSPDRHATTRRFRSCARYQDGRHVRVWFVGHHEPGSFVRISPMTAERMPLDSRSLTRPGSEQSGGPWACSTT